jgi:pimeloyl-ACP methyl ester carboxylesterase
MDEDVEVVLVAHSAGGALSQYVLGKGRVRVKALCLFAAVPGFGSAAVYTFWLPIVPIQMPYRLFHPRYPLATTSAVKSSFFSPGMPLSRVSVFERLLAPYESLRWPLQMLPPVGKAVNILRSITGWRTGAVKESDGSRPGHTLVNDCLFVLAAEHDVLCRPPILRAMAQKYRQGLADLIAPADPEIQAELTDPDADPKDWEGVRFRIVKGVAHHMQNEVEWERGAEGIAIWLDGLEQ